MTQTRQTDRFLKILGRRDVLALAFGAMIGWSWVVLTGTWITSAGVLGAIVAFLVGGAGVALIGLAYAELGTEGSTGPRLFCVSGTVARPGLYEVESGATLREVLALAGGTQGNVKAILLGGAAGGFVTPDDLDIKLTFEDARAGGYTLGSGVVMVLNESVDLVDIVLRIARFFRDESCGQCVPCRVGTVRQEEALHRLVHRREIGSRAQELALIDEIAQVMRDASICGLGQAAPNPVDCVIKYFPHELKAMTP